MAKDYTQLTGDIAQYLGEFTKLAPETMKGFNTMNQAANTDGVLDVKTKELIALAIGVSQRCDGCIAFHVQKLVKLGVTREELAETMAVVAYMGGGPSLMYVADALRAFDQFSE